MGGTRSQPIKVQPPGQVVSIKMGCSARSDKLYLPSYFMAGSSFVRKSTLLDAMSIYNIYEGPMWSRLKEALLQVKIKDLPHKFKTRDSFDLDELIGELDNVETIKPLYERVPLWTWIVCPLVGIVLCAVIYLKLKNKLQNCFRKKRMSPIPAPRMKESVNDRLNPEEH